jgi:GAF domain-containing protein
METILERPVNEQKRIEALKRYNILDTPRDGSFDHITAIASTIFKVPISIISLVDSDRIWFKSHHGVPVNQIDRSPGLCASAIMAEDTYVVENARTDARTLANPLVAGEFGLQFYAAAPLQSTDGYNLGTLCIIDKMPRKFNGEEKVILKQLARIVMDEMEMRLALRNTVSNIRKIAEDISMHINTTLRSFQTDLSSTKQQDVISHLEASQMYLKNIMNQIKQL